MADQDGKQASPAALRLTLLLVVAAGLYCAWLALAGLWTGDMPLPARGSSSTARWESQPGWFLGALAFYGVVVGAALWAVIRHFKGETGRQ